ncbi:hypothetical protein ABB02_00007 [Clostridiaceae bacterium JG1575]|nr:hypothetical protein ABB02_00007 [Clostridiaceae bacterium JG1575]
MLLGQRPSKVDLAAVYCDVFLQKDLAQWPEGDEAELCVLDDVSSALDVDTEKALWRALAAHDKTRLVVSTRPFCLSLADRVLVLKDGAVGALETPKELLERSREFRALLGEEAPKSP